jgi:hypothetical protein
MSVKPTKGMKVVVNASKEAIFGEDEVAVRKISVPVPKARNGTLTGRTLAGFCETEMPHLDGGKHWYPLEDVTVENGEKLVEEEVLLEDGSSSDEESEES